MSDPFAPISIASERAKRGGTAPNEWTGLIPVPTDAPAPPSEHPKLGKPSGRWAYRSASGELLGFACRFDGPDGKQFRPLTLWRHIKNQKLAWRWEAWPVPRPLFGLDRLTERSDALVILTEGEKASEAAAMLLPDVVTITSPNGAKSAGKADWTPLSGRHVVIWPDADEAGAAYADAVAGILAEIGAASVKIVTPPEGVETGWDGADALADGWTSTQAESLVRAARATEAAAGGGLGGGVIDATPRLKSKRKGIGSDDGPKIRAKDQIVAFLDEVELWRDEGGKSFATFDVNGHRETWPLSSNHFRRWLSLKAYEGIGLAPTGSAIEDAVRVADAKSARGSIKTPLLRCSMHEGAYYLDLCDADWRAVRVTAAGWDVVENSGVPFTRSGAMRALPIPVQGVEYDIAQLLAPFTGNVEAADFPLLVAWIIGALRERGPYPIAVLNSRMDSGKSTLSMLIRSLIDPSIAPIRASPRDDRDLLVAAVNSHVIALDNLSSVPAWLSDALCRLATGGGFSARKLHTDASEFVLQAVKPIILNGIPSLTNQPDLASRALILRLKPIADAARMAEEDFLSAWEKVRPQVLGLLLDAMSQGFADAGKVALPKLPRMAGFVTFAYAALPATGINPEAFLAAYTANRRDIIEQSFENDPVAVAIRAFVVAEYPTGWEGTASALLAAIEHEPYATFTTLKSSTWPKSVAALGNRLERVAPLLETVGWVVIKRHSGQRLISIMPKKT